MKYIAHLKLMKDMLRRVLPEYGLWVKAYLSGKPNENIQFDGTELDTFIKDGFCNIISTPQGLQARWQFSKGITAGDYQIVIQSEIFVTQVMNHYNMGALSDDAN